MRGEEKQEQQLATLARARAIWSESRHEVADRLRGEIARIEASLADVG